MREYTRTRGRIPIPALQIILPDRFWANAKTHGNQYH